MKTRTPSLFRSPGARAWSYLLLLALLALLADRGLAALMQRLYSRDRGGEHGGRVEKILRGKERPFLIVLGSSRAAHGVEPARFPYPVYNLGHDGRGPCFALGVLELLEEKGALPAAILLSLDREQFLDSFATGFALRDRRFLRTLRKPGNWIDRGGSASWPLTDRLKFASALYPYNGQLLYLLKDAALARSGREPADGFEPLMGEPSDSASLPPRFNDPAIPARVEGRPVSDGFVTRIAELARRRHVFLAAFTPPEYRNDPRYYGRVSPHLDSLLAADGVPYLDVNRMPGWPLDDARLFKNRGHLNGSGAVVLSDTLARWLEPLLRARTNRDRSPVQESR